MTFALMEEIGRRGPGMKTLLSAIMLLALWSPADAQVCRHLPPGPEKAQCVQQNYSLWFEIHLARCKDLAIERGYTRNRQDNRTRAAFVAACMRGEQI